jgi:hypothetical protein
VSSDLGLGGVDLAGAGGGGRRSGGHCESAMEQTTKG